MIMKDKHYFTHDNNARSDIKIRRLIQRHGMAGYGIYWALVEDLYNNSNELPADYEYYAYEFHVDIEVVRSIINDFELFICDGKHFRSNSVQRRLDIIEAKRLNARLSASKRWEKCDGNAMAMQPQCDGNANAMQTQCDCNANKINKNKNKIKINKNITKEKKENNKKKEKKSIFPSIFPETFSEKRIKIFTEWLEYKKEIKDYYKSEKSIKALFEKWKDVSDDELELIVQQSISNGWKGLFPLKKNNAFVPVNQINSEKVKSWNECYKEFNL